MSRRLQAIHSARRIAPPRPRARPPPAPPRRVERLGDARRARRSRPARAAMRQRGVRDAEVLRGADGLGAADPQPLVRQRERGVERAPDARVEHRLVDQREAGLPQRDQVAGQVAAVHRGDVRRLEHASGRAGRTSCRSGRGSGASAPASGSASSRRRTMSSSGDEARDRSALTVASSCRPMLVGDVRIATTGVGILLEVVGREPVASPR